MADFKTIRIDQIAIPERLRAVEEDHALAIAQSIVEHGLLNPITVRWTPAAGKGQTPYTLVAGAHRLRGTVLNDDSEIEAMVVEADQAEAQLIEITENLFRNDLSVIDRAVFVQSYRDVWEQKHGKIEPGRPANRANLAQLISDEAEAGFSQHVADRMGFSVRTTKRLSQIAKRLHPTLRAALRGTPSADNQTLLLKLAKEGPKEQVKIAAGLSKEPDIKKVLTLLQPPKVPASADDAQKVVRLQLDAAWAKADKATKRFFLVDVFAVMDVPAEVRTAAFDALARVK